MENAWHTSQRNHRHFYSGFRPNQKKNTCWSSGSYLANLTKVNSTEIPGSTVRRYNFHDRNQMTTLPLGWNLDPTNIFFAWLVENKGTPKKQNKTRELILGKACWFHMRGIPLFGCFSSRESFPGTPKQDPYFHVHFKHHPPEETHLKLSQQVSFFKAQRTQHMLIPFLLRKLGFKGLRVSGFKGLSTVPKWETQKPAEPKPSRQMRMHRCSAHSSSACLSSRPAILW